MFLSYPDIIILAGGLGTRLSEALPGVPKPMAPVNGRPFLEYLLKPLCDGGFRKVILSTGYLGEQIESYFGNRFRNLDLVYSVEKEQLGTGGAVNMAFRKVETPHFMVMNGDTIFRINHDFLFQKHVENLADVTLALRKVKDVSRYGTVQLTQDHRITAFREKSEASGAGLINGGINMISSRYFSALSLPEKFSLENDLFMPQVSKARYYGQDFDNYFLDIGIPEDYLRAQTEFHEFDNR
ncbi:MAG TPA: nucleotidyltransferase family protein [Lentimicrobium sp.]|jgi:D-glycero-alpha-D-manno-heptose 1-phosphate guanylyltransferase|nr:nucleotidyltransferase family protein [Lentimicrobium sp.]